MSLLRQVRACWQCVLAPLKRAEARSSPVTGFADVLTSSCSHAYMHLSFTYLADSACTLQPVPQQKKTMQVTGRAPSCCSTAAVLLAVGRAQLDLYLSQTQALVEAAPDWPRLSVALPVKRLLPVIAAPGTAHAGMR